MSYFDLLHRVAQQLDLTVNHPRVIRAVDVCTARKRALQAGHLSMMWLRAAEAAKNPQYLPDDERL